MTQYYQTGIHASQLYRRGRFELKVKLCYDKDVFINVTLGQIVTVCGGMMSHVLP